MQKFGWRSKIKLWWFTEKFSYKMYAESVEEDWLWLQDNQLEFWERYCKFLGSDVILNKPKNEKEAVDLFCTMNLARMFFQYCILKRHINTFGGVNGFVTAFETLFGPLEPSEA